MTNTFDFSIIIPTRNRPAQFATALDAIRNLDYPCERFEVVVVDDGGDVSLEPILEPHRAALQIKLLRQPHGGPALARNRGAEAARGRILAFTDDDCAPAADWLTKLASSLKDAPSRAVGGQTVNALHDNPYSETSQLLIDHLYSYFNSKPAGIFFLASCNLALPAEVYRAVGGFDPSYPRAAAEDRDFCDRLRFHGYSMSYAADAVVCHRHPLTLSTFWRQHFGYGKGAHRFRLAHRRRSGENIRVEPLRFYSGMMISPFRKTGVRRAFLTSMLMAVSQVANLAGFLWEWMLRKARLSK